MAQPRLDGDHVACLPRLQPRDRPARLGLVDQLEGRPGELGVAQDLAAHRPGEEAGGLLVASPSVIPPSHHRGMPDDHEESDEVPEHDLSRPRRCRRRGGRSGQQDDHGEGAAHDHTFRSARPRSPTSRVGPSGSPSHHGPAGVPTPAATDPRTFGRPPSLRTAGNRDQEPGQRRAPPKRGSRYDLSSVRGEPPRTSGSPRVGQRPRTWVACGPFWPWPTSKLTR
jgi:hypothetical protein